MKMSKNFAIFLSGEAFFEWAGWKHIQIVTAFRTENLVRMRAAPYRLCQFEKCCVSNPKCYRIL